VRHIIKTWKLFDNYIIARWQNRPSTALFWYLPEPANIKSKNDLLRYQQTKCSPFYLIDYRKKLSYSLENENGIIVLPYNGTIGKQINPEAAFQYALGLHDQFCLTKNNYYLEKFWRYANYFLSCQSQDGLWSYNFDWYGSKAPWYSALAQSRGASVMLRAWLISLDQTFLDASKKALSKFSVLTSKGGFLHTFKPSQCVYFEEYPEIPTGVINGFMASLLSIWELRYWSSEKWLEDLWQVGISSLQSMLPYYSNGWWSLYDLDANTPIANVNSPRYHLLEMNYLQVLSILSDAEGLKHEYETRAAQYNNSLSRLRALSLKSIRKILYR
jgi:hypothetical protein